MSFIAIGTGILTLAGSLIGSATRGGRTTTQQLKFPEETRQLIQDVEFPLLEGVQGEQQSLMRLLLGTPGQSPFQRTQLGGATPLLRAAAHHGAKNAGVTDLGPVETGVTGFGAELITALRELGRQRAAQARTVVPPGFQTFLSPSTSIEQSGGGFGESLQTGFALGGQLAQFGSRFL